MKKVTVALGRAEYTWAEHRARSKGTSLSAVLTAAARDVRDAEERDTRQREAWLEIERFVVGGSPLTADDMADARRELNAVESEVDLVARQRMLALRALGHPAIAELGTKLPPRGPRGGLWRPRELYGLIYEAPARKLLELSSAKFRALVLPAAWVKNPRYSTAPKVGVYDPRTLLALREMLRTAPDALAEQEQFVRRRRQQIDAEVHEGHREFMSRAQLWAGLRAERTR